MSILLILYNKKYNCDNYSKNFYLNTNLLSVFKNKCI